MVPSGYNCGDMTSFHVEAVEEETVRSCWYAGTPMKAAEADTALSNGADDRVELSALRLACDRGETGIVDESCVTCLILRPRIALNGVPNPEIERGFLALDGIMEGMMLGGGPSGTSMAPDELAILDPPDRPSLGCLEGEAYAEARSLVAKSNSTPASCIPKPASPPHCESLGFAMVIGLSGMYCCPPPGPSLTSGETRKPPLVPDPVSFALSRPSTEPGIPFGWVAPCLTKGD